MAASREYKSITIPFSSLATTLNSEQASGWHLDRWCRIRLLLDGNGEPWTPSDQETGAPPMGICLVERAFVLLYRELEQPPG